MNFYNAFRSACAAKGTSLTTVLAKNGRSTGVTGNWKAGQSPRLDLVIEIADSLGITIDELIYGIQRDANYLDDDQRELLQIYSAIPQSKHQLCKDFLRTHVADVRQELRQDA